MNRAVFFLILLCVSLQVWAAQAPSDTAAAFNSRGLYHMRTGDYSAALESFSKAAQINPAGKHYYNNMAAVYIKTGRYALAEKKLRICIAMDSTYSRALSNMAVALFHQKRYAEAYRYYRKSREADPSYTEKRFKRKRVINRLRSMSRQEPADSDIKKILDHLERQEGK